jgi:hypothetical protein
MQQDQNDQRQRHDDVEDQYNRRQHVLLSPFKTLRTLTGIVGNSWAILNNDGSGGGNVNPKSG